MSTKNRSINQSNTNNNNNTIDEHKVWQDISTFMPNLTYGEESLDLLNSILCLPFGLVIVGGAEDSVGNLKDCNKNERLSADVHKRKEVSLSNLGRVLNNMLHVRCMMRKRVGSNTQQQQAAADQQNQYPHRAKRNKRLLKRRKHLNLQPNQQQ